MASTPQTNPLRSHWATHLSLLFEELETLSLLNPVGEQGGFSHTYFHDMDVQTGSRRELAFHSLYF